MPLLLFHFFFLFVLVVLSFVLFRLYQIQNWKEIDYLLLLSENAFPLALTIIILLLYVFIKPLQDPILIIVYCSFGIVAWFKAIKSTKSYRKITSPSIRIPQETYSIFLIGIMALFSLLPDVGPGSADNRYFQSAKVFLFLSIAAISFMKLFFPTLFLSTGIVNFPFSKTPWETVSKISWSKNTRNKVIVHSREPQSGISRNSDYLIPWDKLGETYHFLDEKLPHLDIPEPKV